MNDERRKVLEMLAAGKVTPEEAERLLEKLTGANSTESEPEGAPAPGSHERTKGIGTILRGWQSPKRGKLNYMRIDVTDGEGDDVNIRLPLGLLRTGLKISTMLPRGVNAKLREQGVDLSSLTDLDGDELIEQLREFNIDVTGSDGERVRVYCE